MYFHKKCKQGQYLDMFNQCKPKPGLSRPGKSIPYSPDKPKPSGGGGTPGGGGDKPGGGGDKPGGGGNKPGGGGNKPYVPPWHPKHPAYHPGIPSKPVNYPGGVSDMANRRQTAQTDAAVVAGGTGGGILAGNQVRKIKDYKPWQNPEEPGIQMTDLPLSVQELNGIQHEAGQHMANATLDQAETGNVDEDLIDIDLGEPVAAEGVAEGATDAVATGAAEGAIASGIDTAGIGFAVGGLMLGGVALSHVFRHSGHKIKDPGNHRIEGREREDYLETLQDHNKNGRYDTQIANIKAGGHVYITTLNNRTKQITHQLSEQGYANAIVAVQKNPNAYKGQDPYVLQAMGLNPLLAKGWDRKAKILGDPNHNVAPDKYSRALYNYDQLNKQKTQAAQAQKKKSTDTGK